MIAARRVDVSQIISHGLPLSQVGDAYELPLAGSGMKIVRAADEVVAASCPDSVNPQAHAVD